jgi:hypothetical protein
LNTSANKDKPGKGGANCTTAQFAVPFSNGRKLTEEKYEAKGSRNFMDVGTRAAGLFPDRAGCLEQQESVYLHFASQMLRLGVSGQDGSR